MSEKGKGTPANEPDVKNFVVNYTDGSQRIIEKGFFCEITKGPAPDGYEYAWEDRPASIRKAIQRMKGESK